MRSIFELETRTRTGSFANEPVFSVFDTSSSPRQYPRYRSAYSVSAVMAGLNCGDCQWSACGWDGWAGSYIPGPAWSKPQIRDTI